MDIDYLLSLGIEGERADALLEAVNSELEAAEKRRVSDKYASTLDGLLKSAGALNVKAARAVLNYDFDGNDFDGIPDGLDEAVTLLKLEAPYLFESGGEISDEREIYTFVGISPAEACDGEVSGEDMTYSEFMRRSKKTYS
ncbi:MAG: phage scaffolding protein [Firmicutes bacterium]|nr:phage scaffolding protein [Bacillota bacterium]